MLIVAHSTEESKDGIGFVWNIYMAQPEGFIMERKNIWDAAYRNPFIG